MEQPALKIYNRIRGLSPIPTAYTTLNGKILKVYRAKIEPGQPDVPAGTYLTDNRSHLKFAAIDGFISLTDVQMEGKKRMTIEEFLRGVKL